MPFPSSPCNENARKIRFIVFKSMFSPAWDKWGRGDKEKENEEGVSFTAECPNRIFFNACGEISRYGQNWLDLEISIEG